MKSQKGLPRKTHGLSLHPLYRRVIHIIERCYKPEQINYSRYGGRGIRVCDEWRESPVTFVYWALENGWEPHLQIDRIDNDGDYTPYNCRFVTNAENMRNSRSAKLNRRLVSYIKMRLMLGEKQQDIADRYGVDRRTISSIKTGRTWSDIK